MKQLHLSYDMLIEYSEEVSKCNFTIKCIPVNSLRQRISNVQIQIVPNVNYSYGKDGLYNIQIYGVNDNPHKSFQFHIEADAKTGLSDYEIDTNNDLDMIFKHEHGLNVAGYTIRLFCSTLTRINRIQSTFDKATELMHELSRNFVYLSGSTDVNTTAEDAFKQGFGVCQDFAHIFISFLHEFGIASRYVTGFIVGEGESHAWVEVLCGTKWYGFDPTHDRMVNDDYIRLGIGRDAKDCMINRGIMHGGGFHTQKISVQVSEKKNSLIKGRIIGKK